MALRLSEESSNIAFGAGAQDAQGASFGGHFGVIGCPFTEHGSKMCSTAAELSGNLLVFGVRLVRCVYSRKTRLGPKSHWRIPESKDFGIGAAANCGDNPRVLLFTWEKEAFGNGSYFAHAIASGGTLPRQC